MAWDLKTLDTQPPHDLVPTEDSWPHPIEKVVWSCQKPATQCLLLPTASSSTPPHGTTFNLFHKLALTCSLPGVWTNILTANPTPRHAGLPARFLMTQSTFFRLCPRLALYLEFFFSPLFTVFAVVLFKICPSRSSWNVIHPFRSLPSPPTGNLPGAFFLAEFIPPSAMPTGLPFLQNFDIVHSTASHSYSIVSVR